MTRARANLLGVDLVLVEAVDESARECYRLSRESWEIDEGGYVDVDQMTELHAALDDLDTAFERAGRRRWWWRSSR
jgi:hypothetical protein